MITIITPDNTFYVESDTGNDNVTKIVITIVIPILIMMIRAK